jgi:hypothetical protein
MSPNHDPSSIGSDFDPNEKLFVGNILDAPRSRDAFDQDLYEGLMRASRIVLNELEVRGIKGATDISERLAELGVANEGKTSPLSLIANEYFGRSRDPYPNGEGDDEYRLGCLADVAEWLAAVHVSPSDEHAISEAYSSIEEYFGPFDAETTSILFAYLQNLRSV